MSKKKNNIRPENVGSLFFDGKDYCRLIACESEPHATFANWLKGGETETKPISKFSKFVLLKPVREIVKPRADLGGKHQRRERKQASTLGAPPLPLKEKGTDDDLISTFSMATSKDKEHYKFHTLKMGNIAVEGRHPKEDALALLATCGLTQQDVEAAPESEGKKKLLIILK